VFLGAAPIAALALLASWLILQVELRQWPKAGPGALWAGTPPAGDLCQRQPG
jgi:hypothetical protein